MARSISIRTKIVIASTAKPNKQSPPGYKSLGIETAICFYEIEDGDNTEEVEAWTIAIIRFLSETWSKLLSLF